MSEDNSWLEQDIIDAWLGDNGIAVDNKKSMELKISISKYRIELQSQLEQVTRERDANKELVQIIGDNLKEDIQKLARALPALRKAKAKLQELGETGGVYCLLIDAIKEIESGKNPNRTPG